MEGCGNGAGGKQKTAGGKDGRRWSFCRDAEAAQPALLKDEEWKDVVAGHGLHEVDVKGITGQTEGQVDIAQVRKELQKRGRTWPRVSSLGRFRDSHGVIKVPIASTDGYVQVGVFGSKYCLHGLVARAFIEGKVPPGHTVDHIDLNRSNNAIANLRYLTPRQQNAHSYATNPDRESNAGGVLAIDPQCPRLPLPAGPTIFQEESVRRFDICRTIRNQHFHPIIPPPRRHSLHCTPRHRCTALHPAAA